MTDCRCLTVAKFLVYSQVSGLLSVLLFTAIAGAGAWLALRSPRVRRLLVQLRLLSDK